MRIRGSEFLEQRLVIDFRIRQLKAAHAFGNVGANIVDARNLGQIASDRDGTAPSVHVGDVEADGGDAVERLCRQFNLGVGRPERRNGRIRRTTNRNECETDRKECRTSHNASFGGNSVR